MGRRMNKHTIDIIGVLVIIVLIIGFLGFQLKGSQNNVSKEVQIGVLLPLTGNAAYYGEASRRGIEIAKEEIQKSYPDFKLNIVYEDTQYTVQGGVAAYKKIQNTENIDAVITAASQVSLAVLPLTTQDNLLQMAIFSSTNKYSSPNDLSYRVSTKNDIEVSAIVEVIKKQEFKTLAIVYINNDFGVGIKDALQKQLARSVDIVAEEAFLPEENDFRTLLIKIKSKKPEAIFMVGTAVSYGLILKQARELDIKTQFISTRSAEDPVLLQQPQEITNGLIYAYPFDGTKQTKEVKNFIKEFQKKYETVPDAYAAEGYEGFKLTVLAIKDCGREKECIQTYFKNTKEYNSLFGPLSFDINGDVTYPFFLKMVRDGQFVPLN